MKKGRGFPVGTTVAVAAIFGSFAGCALWFLKADKEFNVGSVGDDYQSRMVLLHVVGYICLGLIVVYTLYAAYRRFNQKNRLVELSLGAIAGSFPRIAKINCETGICIFIKEQEDREIELFKKCSWENFREKFLMTIHSEDYEKCRAFTSLESMRRICDKKPDGDTCIYRRMYDGEYQWIQATVLPVKEEPEQILMYSRMVHESVKAEEFYKARLWEAAQKARRAESEKTEYLRYLAQHLKNPVKTLREEILEEKQAESSGHLERFTENGDILTRYLLRTMEDMVQVGVMQERQLSCKKAPFLLERLAQVCGELYGRTEYAQKQIRFETEYDKTLSREYVGDELRVLQVLDTFLSNAFHFTGQGGEIRLQIKLLGQEDGTDEIAFSVLDNGIGIREEFKPLIFEAFARENANPMVDSGLGLTFAKMALDAMEGRLEVESHEGKGSCFTMILKLRRAEEGKWIHPGDIRVLLVDDNPANLDMMEELLEMEGYQSDRCKSGEEAWNKYQASGNGYYSVVLTDIKMPGMDGFDLSRQIRNAGRSDSRELCVVGITTEAGTKMLEMAAASGMEMIFEKPFRVFAFRKFLERKDLQVL